MNARGGSTSRIAVVLVALIFAYFVVFPDDTHAVTSPIAAVLALSQAVSPWLYLVIVVGILTYGLVRGWGRRETLR